MRSLYGSLACVVLCTLLSSSVAAQEPGGITGISAPRLSPDGTQIAFSYQGDIWYVDSDGGLAHRLTDNAAYDSWPVWSPDGRQIAFSSNRRGNYDIYRMPLYGGFPDRITWGPENDYLTDWHDDTLLFTSRRWGYSQDIYSIHIPEIGDGTHMEHRITWDETRWRDAFFSPDGSQIVASRGRYGWTRKRYVGSGSMDVMTMNADGSDIDALVEPINDPQGTLDAFPAWGGGSIFYIGDADDFGRNIYQVPASGGDAQKLTSFKKGEESADYLSASKDGSMLAFTRAGRLYTLTPGGNPDELFIRIDSERKRPELERMQMTGGATEAMVSPDGRYVATVIRGDIFIVPVTDPDNPPPLDSPRFGEAWNVTDSIWRDFSVSWHPDSDKIAFVSDMDGDFEVYTMDLNTEDIKQITKDDRDAFNPKFSPDGKKLAFIRDKKSLVVTNSEGRNARKVADGYFGFGGVYHQDYMWSPDSQWIAYEHLTHSWNGEIFIADSDNKMDAVNVTRHYISSWSPRWSADGQYLYFLSDRGEVGDFYPRQAQVYRLQLTKRPLPYSDEFTFGDDEDEGDDESGDDLLDEDESDEDSDDSNDHEDDSDEDGDEATDDEKIEPVEIDWDRIEYRVEGISSTAGFASGLDISPDGEWIVYGHGGNSQWELAAVHTRSGETNRLGSGIGTQGIHFNADGSKLYTLSSGGGIVEIGFGGGNSSGQRGIAISARKDLDTVGEYKQMYKEGWRALKEGFYVEDMHGVDWEKMFDRYEPLALNAATPEEFQLVVSLLLGELSASHLGIWGPNSFDGRGETGAKLGVDFDPDYNGPGLKIEKILADGPADHDDSRLEVGEVILEVAGEKVGPEDSIWKALESREYKTTRLLVKGTDGEKRDVKMWPITVGQEWGLRYTDWVETNRAKVKEASDGRLAYIHIQGMNQPSLANFYRELYTRAQEADGLVLDIRHNGGGNIHEQLLDALNRPEFMVAQLRDDEVISQPSQAFHKPVVLLINEGSASDSEIFPEGFRELGLGTIVGVPTLGAVIGTLNYPLIDSRTTFRVPLMGWYALDGRNLENLGVAPDIHVVNDPNGYRSGSDAQLERGIAEALAQL